MNLDSTWSQLAWLKCMFSRYFLMISMERGQVGGDRLPQREHRWNSHGILLRREGDALRKLLARCDDAWCNRFDVMSTMSVMSRVGQTVRHCKVLRWSSHWHNKTLLSFDDFKVRSASLRDKGRRADLYLLDRCHIRGWPIFACAPELWRFFEHVPKKTRNKKMFHVSALNCRTMKDSSTLPLRQAQCDQIALRDCPLSTGLWSCDDIFVSLELKRKFYVSNKQQLKNQICNRESSPALLFSCWCLGK